jgi:uncharacterized protein YjdB
MNMRTIFLAVTGLFVAVTACSDGGTSVEVVQKTPVASVVISLPTTSLMVGQTAHGTAVARDATGVTLPDRPIAWHSSNAAVATVDEAGTIAAVKAGAASISAESEGVSSTANLTVMDGPPAPVASVSVSLAANTLTAGQTTQATATLRDASNNPLSGRVITWSSSDNAVATVNGSGIVTAVAAGSAQITATSEGQNGSAGLSVTAAAVPVATVTVALASSSLNPGQTTQATATTRDASNNVLTGRSVSWSTSNPSVATVSASGLVTAVAVGTAQIIATSETKTGAANLTVAAAPPVPVASVSVALAASSRNPGQTTQATATLRDANNNVLTGRAITWSSGTPGVATVSPSGLVTALAVGTAAIIASCEGQSGSATLTVTAATPAPVATVSVSLAASSLNPTQTTQATATLRDASNNVLTGRSIVWTSSDNTLATVSATGLVTAIAVGNIQITATSETKSGSADLAIQDPAPPGSFNEPSGMTLISERAFNALNEDPLWTDENPAIIATDPTAPASPSKVWRGNFPAGFVGGRGPANSWLEYSFRPRTAYVRWYFKYSSNWYGTTASGINKMFYVWTNSDVPSMVIEASGSGTGPLRLRMAGQDILKGGQGYGDPANPDWDQNLVPSFEITRGVWHMAEIVLVGNTAGNADGSFDAWVDGIHVTSHTGIQFRSAAALWGNMNLDPVYGGGASVVPETQTWDLDHFYMSGKK